MATIREIIGRVDENKFNEYSEQLKLRWVAILDGKIAVDVLLMHPSETKQFNYAYPEGMDTEPLVAFPHDDIYDLWLEAQIDMKNGEYEKYQNAMLQFNAAYDNFVNWFLTHHAPETALGTDVNGMGGGPFYYITAYGLAVRQGFDGTLEQWLESLVGEKGEPGKDACIYPGEGAYSAQGGIGNEVISDTCFNYGRRNFVGLKGYYYSGIDFETNKITLSTKQDVAEGNGIQLAWAVGDEVSIVNNDHYYRCSKITAINGNVITVDSLPFKEVIVPEELEWDDYTIFVLDKPEAGTARIDLGRDAMTIGEDNRVTDKGAGAIGRGHDVQAKYGFTVNRGNIIRAYAGFSSGAFNIIGKEAEYGSTHGVENEVTAPVAHAGGSNSKARADGADADGYMCEVDGEWGLARNYKTKVTAPYAVALNEETEAGGKGSLTGGKGTKSIAPYQTYLGKFNYPSTNHLFGIGMGTSDADRENAFVIRKDGDADFCGHRARNFAEAVTVIECKTKESIEKAISNTWANMADNSIKHIILDVKTSGLVLPSGRWFITLNQAFFNGGTLTGICYSQYGAIEVIRNKYDSWGEWEWVNPPMHLGEEYRTTERWQGKAVYTKLVDIGRLPNNTLKTVELGVSASFIFRSKAAAYDEAVSDIYIALPYINPALEIISYYIKGTSIIVHTNSNASIYGATVQIWYIQD